MKHRTLLSLSFILALHFFAGCGTADAQSVQATNASVYIPEPPAIYIPEPPPMYLPDPPPNQLNKKILQRPVQPRYPQEPSSIQQDKKILQRPVQRRWKKAQFKKTIAVAGFHNRTTAAGQINLGRGMADQLTNALFQSDNFVVLERESMADVLREQDFAGSQRTKVSKTAQQGKVVPAQILIKGTITEFQLEESGGGTGVSYMGFSFGHETSTAHVALVLRIIDTTSGQVLDSVRIEGKSTGTGYKFGVSYMGIGVEGEQFENTALNKAVQMVINQGVNIVSRNLNRIPFEGKIIKAKDDYLYTNIGLRNRVSGGDIFDVYSPGDELFDPDTGEKLGSLKKKVGTLVISAPSEKYSKAFSSNHELFKEGFILIERKDSDDENT